MAYTKHTIELVRQLRSDGLSYQKIGDKLGITKNQVLALAYKHIHKINRHEVYRDRDRVRATLVADRELRPSVPFVRGLNDTCFYVVSNRRINLCL